MSTLNARSSTAITSLPGGDVSFELFADATDGLDFAAKEDANAANRPQLLIGKVGDFRLDNLYQLDLRLEKAFQIGPVTVTPAAEVFNVINSSTVLQRYSRVGTYNNGEFSTDDAFYTIQETQSPRILRLGIRMSF